MIGSPFFVIAMNRAVQTFNWVVVRGGLYHPFRALGMLLTFWPLSGSITWVATLIKNKVLP